MATISGNVKDVTGANVARSVRAHVQATGALAGQTISDPVTGNFSIAGLSAGVLHTVIALDGIADLYRTNLSLLMYGNGANGGTVFTDEMGHAVNRVGTVTTTSTAQSKFNGSSILNTGTGGHININGSGAEFTLGTGDFTVEMWAYLTDISGNCQLLDWRPLSTEGKYPALVVWSSGKLGWHSDTTVNFDSTGTVGTNTWHHIAVTRTGGYIRFFIDGVLDETETSDATNFLGGSTVRPCFGYGPNPGVSFPIKGHLCSIAVYKGVAKYTESFLLPTMRAGDVRIYGENSLIFESVVPV